MAPRGCDTGEPEHQGAETVIEMKCIWCGRLMARLMGFTQEDVLLYWYEQFKQHVECCEIRRAYHGRSDGRDLHIVRSNNQS